MVLLKKTTDPRPVFLNLFKIQLPMNALVSILHRITGVVMILALPLLAVVLLGVLSRPGVFYYLAKLPIWLQKAVVASTVSAYMYHIMAGVRHMYHDVSGQHTLRATQISAACVLTGWLIWLILVGGKLWLI